MDYILFGIQGSGKGTQGKLLAKQLSSGYFETGGQLRILSEENSQLGRKVKSIINAGHLVPLEVVIEIAKIFIKRHSDSAIIFDGIPRDFAQDEKFKALLTEHGREYMGILFTLSRNDAEYRLLKRRMCTGCKTVYPAGLPKSEACEMCGGILVARVDDNEESIRIRLDIFFKETMPVIESWRKEGKLIEIDGAKSIEQVTRELYAKLKL